MLFVCAPYIFIIYKKIFNFSFHHLFNGNGFACFFIDRFYNHFFIIYKPGLTAIGLPPLVYAQIEYLFI